MFQTQVEQFVVVNRKRSFPPAYFLRANIFALRRLVQHEFSTAATACMHFPWHCAAMKRRNWTLSGERCKVPRKLLIRITHYLKLPVVRVAISIIPPNSSMEMKLFRVNFRYAGNYDLNYFYFSFERYTCRLFLPLSLVLLTNEFHVRKIMKDIQKWNSHIFLVKFAVNFSAEIQTAARSVHCWCLSLFPSTREYKYVCPKKWETLTIRVGIERKSKR